MPGDRRDRIRRRAAGAPAARRGARGALPDPRPAAGCATCRGRPASRSSRATSPTGDGLRGRAATASTSPTTWCTRSAGADFEDARPARRARTSPPPRPRGRRRPDRLPRRPAPDRRAAPRRTCAPAPRSAEILLAGGVPDRRAAGRGDHRLRLGVVRDAALPDRAAAGHGHARAGCATGSSRSPSATCCTTWSRCADAARRTSTAAFDIGGPDVLTYARDDAALRRGRRPAPAGASCRSGR